MALAGHIIQTNLNHSARAQDLLLQTMAEYGSGLAVVVEPYRIPQDYGIGDNTGTVALIRARSADFPTINTIVRGNGYVVATWGGTIIVGVYASPNAPVSALQEQLDEIRNNIAPLMAQEIMVLGDFNAKSTIWGSPRTNPRGEAVEEWAAELNLQLINEGTHSTCVRWQGESIVDLTWASLAAARKIRSWEVVLDAETLSDHRYITIKFSREQVDTRHNQQPKRQTSGQGRQREPTPYPRWAFKKLNRERLLTAAHAESWIAPSQEETTTEINCQAESFHRQITRIDAAMPRTRSRRKNAAYWWTPDLEKKRRDCVLTCRKVQHLKRKRTPNAEEKEQAYSRYRAAVNLQKAIKEAKNKAWEKLQQTIDRDPWGKPYKIVMEKLRPSAPPLTETMDSGLLERVLDKLFPRGSDQTRVEENNIEGSTLTTLAPVTPAEMSRAIKKMTSKNTAPGPDGVPGKAMSLALSVLNENLRHIFSNCIREGVVSERWKSSRLVLIPKPGKEPNDGI